MKKRRATTQSGKGLPATGITDLIKRPQIKNCYSKDHVYLPAVFIKPARDKNHQKKTKTIESKIVGNIANCDMHWFAN